MCGILGYFDESPIRRETFETMRDQMRHRGPDGSGASYFEGDRVALAHRRLSIIDLSDDGQQPMPNEDKTLWLTFNGEIYNHLELRQQLIASGHRFSSNMDGEVLLHGFETWGLEGLLQRVNGMFAFGIYNQKTGQFHCARDRFGIKPFVYYHDGQRFLFASELKAILKHPDLDKSIRLQSLADYFNYGYVPHPHTPWEHIHKLPPGHFLSFSTGIQGKRLPTAEYGQGSAKGDQGPSALKEKHDRSSSKASHGPVSSKGPQRLSIRQYYTLQTASKIIARAEATRNSAALLKNAVEGHLTSDVPVGLFLSGGYDSTAVLHYTKELGHDLDSFTLGFANSKNSEHHLAEQIADIYQTPNRAQVLQNDEDYWETLFHQAEFYDEPYAVSSMIPYYYVSQLAAQTHKVILGGDGGDEVFAGYRWHAGLHNGHRRQSGSQGPGRDRSLKDRLTARLKNQLKQLIRGKHQMLLTDYNRHMNGLRYRSEAFEIWKDDEIPALADASNLDYFRANYRKELSPVKRMQVLDINTFMLEACLMRADQTSMIHSLEVRLPFLDHRLVEYLMSLSPEVYFEPDRKKILLYNTLSQKIPENVLSQPKRGFGFQHLSELFGGRFREVMQGGELEKLGLIHKNTDWESVSVRTKFIFVQLEMWCRRFSI